MSNSNETNQRQAGNAHGIILILCAVMPVMAIVSLIPILPLLMREFAAVEGASFLVPVALTVPALCVALFSPLAGWLSDRVGRKKLLLGALLLYAAIGVLPVFLTDLYLIIGARFGLGIAEAIIMTIATALIGDYFDGAAREKWIGIQIAVVSISAVVVSALGGVLGEMGSRGPFFLYLLAIPTAVAVAIVLFEPQSVRHEEIKSQSFPWPQVTPLLVITFLVSIYFYTAVVKIGPILELVSVVSPAFIGIVAALYNLGVAVGSFSYQKFKAASGPQLLAVGMLLFTTGYLGMGFSSSVAMTTVFALATSLGAGLLLPTMLNWVMQVIPPGVRGRGIGMWTGMFFFGQFIAPIVSAAIETPVGGLGNALLAYGAFAAIGLILALIFTKSGSKTRTP